MNIQYQKIKNLFLQQSYLDAWEDYVRSLRKASFIKWDYLILTASNEEQAESYRRQIRRRLSESQLPDETEYIVLADPDGKRVGSGGATLNVLRCVAEKENRDDRKDNPFRGKRILVIHSGGDSKRIPQYSACGKLFSPIPRELPDGRPSTLFDELVIGMSGVPSRIKDGMMVLSGDVLLLFNPLQIDFQFRGAAGITMKQPAEVGKDHGVFLNDGNNYVRRFLHKQTVDNLRGIGAADGQDMVDLDTGAVLCDCDLLAALYSLICTDGVPDREKFGKFVSEDARISFYGDFLYPLAGDSVLEEYYIQEPEETFTQSLRECRTEIWNVLHEFSMKLFLVSPAEFIHFGTTRELLQLVTETVDSYEFLDWKRSVMSTAEDGIAFAANNSVIGRGDMVGDGAYIENSFLAEEEASHKTTVGGGSILSSVRLRGADIPEGCVVSGIWLKNGKCVARIYGVHDNPKESSLLGTGLGTFEEKNGLASGTIWRAGEQRQLWTAYLYPVRETMEEAVESALTVYRMAKGTASAEETDLWKSAPKESLCSSFNRADNQKMFDWSLELRDSILVQKFVKAIGKGEDYKDALGIFGGRGVSERQYDLLWRTAQEAPFYERIKILYSLSRYMKEENRIYHGKTSFDEVERLCFKEIQDSICVYNNARPGSLRIREEEISVNLPVRVNWGGGWTDTPPYCNEHGGVVINAAIKLNGVLPIQVCVRRLPDFHVEFESEDIGVFGRFTSLEEIQNCHDPYDSFALHKAALLAYGIVPMEGGESLERILEDLGGGIYLSTQVVGVPQGSGLGTSSILAGACMIALSRFFGSSLSDNEIYEKVLCMEQIMSTGGGWQDQVGGIAPGVKFITTRPGLAQKIKVEPVELSEALKTELQERFALVYTGQRRLARNLLRKVLGGYLSGRRDSVLALKKMPELAVLMKFELERGNLDAFAELLNKHWELSVQLDPGTTNTCIDQIFMACEDLIDGKFIAGAGGGGFLMVILKKGVTKDLLRERLYEVFHDNGVDVWDSEFVY